MYPASRLFILAALLSFTSIANADPAPHPKPVKPAAHGALLSGKASWYGPGFHGRRTASGEIFNANSMTAAHKTLPFGTRVRVTSRKTGRSVVVRINDRGPFVRGRVIDLSKASARMLGLAGLSDITISVL